MKHLRTIGRTLFTLSLALLLIVSATSVAVASPTVQAEEVDLEGAVTAIDESAGSFTLEVDEDGGLTSYTVQPPEDFDLTTLSVGDEVEVEGTLEEDLITATSIEILESEDDEDDEDGEGDENYYCANPDDPHPVGQALTSVYDVSYEQVLTWFCEGSVGFGQIMLGLQTAALTDGSADTYLDRRADGEGWGQIWLDMDLIGRPEEAGPPEDTGRPEDAGPPEDRGRPDNPSSNQGGGQPSDR
ncbi:MAG: DUF5666 domain-containing protein [Anaerolineales bacterium]